MKRRSGQTAVMMALSLTMIFGLFGFTVDLGASYYQKQKAQAAAESAALAAASYAKTNGVTCGTNGITCTALTSCSSITSTSSPVLYVGCQYANQNGYPMSSISMAANTTAPPCSNCGSPTYWIQAQVSTTNNNLFLGAANIANPNINAVAVAGVTSQTTTTPGSGVPADCIWVLDPTKGDDETFFVSGANVTLSGCSAQINTPTDGGKNGQPNTMAAVANGNAVLSASAGAGFNVVGGADNPPNQTYCTTFTCHVTAIADPLANLPDVNETTVFGSTSCTQTNYSISQGNVTVPPGIYCGGINISGGNVTFKTGGTFEMRDGPLSISNGTTTGTNVMFWFSTASPTTKSDPLLTINTSSVTLSAPSSGTYQGILFYGNRHAQIAASGTNNTIQASAYPPITGTMYFPTGNVLFSGQSGVNGYVVVDAYRFQINGQSTFKWDTTGTITGLATYGTSTTTTYTPALIQ